MRGLIPSPLHLLLLLLLLHILLHSTNMVSSSTIPLSSSISIFRNPFLQLLRRPTTSVSFNALPRNPTLSSVPSAIATPTSSILTQQPFEGLTLDDVNNSLQFGYDHQPGTTPVHVSDHELDISKLSLPSSLVHALQKRGITSLFPIQVSVLFFSFYFQLPQM